MLPFKGSIGSLFSSTGIKRMIAAVLLPLTGILEIVGGVPGILTATLGNLAAFFGFTGVAHAVPAKTLSKNILATIAAVLAVAVQVAEFIPAVQPYAELLRQLAIIIGAAAAGKAVTVVEAATSPKKACKCKSKSKCKHK